MTGRVDEAEAKALLDARREELEALSALSREARAPVALDQQSVGRLSRMDAMQAQAMDAATERTRQRDLRRIERAETRLRDGEYGFCEECGEPVPDARLRVDPMAERCVGCAR